MATVQMSVRPEDLSQVPESSERIPEPAIVVIFGASGDLTSRKLLPALFHLEQSGLLPVSSPSSAWPGGRWARSSRRTCAPASSSSAACSRTIPSSMNLSPHRLLPAALRCPSRLRRPQGRTGPHRRERRIGGNRVFYLATSPEFFAGIVDNLGAQGWPTPSRVAPPS